MVRIDSDEHFLDPAPGAAEGRGVRTPHRVWRVRRPAGVLEALRAKLDDALSSRGSVVMLAGEPGIGKTALAADLIGTKLRR